MEESYGGASGHTDVRATETAATHDGLAATLLAQQTPTAHIHASVDECGQDRREFRG